MKKPLLSLVIAAIFSAHAFAQNVDIGTNDPKTKLDINGGFSLREGPAITLTTGANDNVVLPDVTGATGVKAAFYRISGPTGAFSLAGIVPITGADGQLVTLVNTTGYLMTIKNEASSTPSNGFKTLTGADIVSVVGSSSVTIQYNKTDSRWYVTGTRNYDAAASGSGNYIQNNAVNGNTGTGQSASFDITGNSEIGGTVRVGGNVGIGSTSGTANTLDVQGGTAGAGTNGSNINLKAQDGGSGGAFGGNVNINSGAGTSGNASGNVNINNSSSGNVIIASGTSAQTVNIANDNTGAKTVNIGGTGSTSATTINAGSGGVKVGTLTSAGASYVKANAAGVLSPQTGVPTSDLTGTISGTNLPNFTGDVTSSGTVTTYNNVVPSTKGGAGSVSGILKANGSGTVSAAAASDLSSLANGTFILNQTSQQLTSNFNISSNGTIGGNASVGGTLGVTGTSTLAALTQTGTTSINTTGAAATNIANGGTGTVTIGNSTGDITLPDGTDIILNATTGTKVGTATTQKLGFFNATPVVQQTGNIITGLSNLGLITSGTLAPGNLPDATTTTKGIVQLAGDLGGTSTSAAAPVISDNAITTVKINAGAVTSAKIADANVTTAKIADANVTYAKIQNVSATNQLLGRRTTGAGSIEEIGLGTGLSISSNNLTVSPTGIGGWGTNGNSGTNPSAYSDNAAQANNFLGTTDNQPLEIYTNTSSTKDKTDIKLYTASSPTQAVSAPVDILHIRRNGQTGVTYPLSASFALGKYNNTISSETEMAIKLAAGNVYVPDVTVMTLRANGNVGIGNTTPQAKLNIGGSGAALSGNGIIIGTVGASIVNAGAGGAVGSEVGRFEIAFPGYRDNEANQIGAKIAAIRKNNYQVNNAYIQSTELAFYTGTGTTGSAFTSTFKDMTTEAMRIDQNGNVGIGTTTPVGIIDVRGGTAAANTSGTSINFYAQNGGSGNSNGGNINLIPGNLSGTGTKGWVGVGGTGSSVYGTDMWVENNMHVQGNETLTQGGRGRLRVGTAWSYVGLYAESSSTSVANDLVLGAGSGQVRVGPNGTGQRLKVNGIASAMAVVATDYQYSQGPGTGSDNQNHQVNCSGTYAMVNFSVFATSRWDGDLRINCANLGSALTGSWYWQASQYGGGNTDNQTYTINCPANAVASGFYMYCTGQLDYNPNLLCNPLASGYTTTNSPGFTSAMLGPWDTGADNVTHWAECPTGTFVNGMSFYVSNYADGNLQLRCTGVNFP